MKRTFVLITMLLYAMLLQSQERRGEVSMSASNDYLFKEEAPRSFTLMRIAGAFAHRERVNEMIVGMGQLEGVNPPGEFRTKLHYNERLSIHRQEGELILHASIQFDRFDRVNVSRRDVGFDHYRWLYPDRMSFRLLLLDAAGNTLYEEVLTDVVLEPGGVSQRGETPDFVIARLRLSDEYMTEGMTLRIREIVTPRPHLLFYYSAEKHQRFLAYLEYLEEYPKDARLVAGHVKKLEGITIGNPDHLTEQLTTIEGFKEDVDRVIGKRWESRLPLKEADPERLISSLEMFASLYHDRKEVIQHALRTLDVLYFKEGMKALEQNRVRDAREWFDKALLFNPSHGPTHYQMALLEFNSGHLDQSAKRLNRVLSTMNPDRSLSAEIFWLLTRIQNIQSKSYRDEYNQLLTVAQRNDARGMVTDALEALMKATRYQWENALYLPDNKEAERLAREIFTRQMVEGERAFRERRYDAAINHFRGVQQLFAKHAPGLIDISIIDQRIEEIHRAVIDALTKEARTTMQRGDLSQTEAIIQRIMEASGHQEGEPPPPVVNTLLSEYQNALYQQGVRLMNEGSFARAFETFGQTMNAARQYGLTPPGDLLAVMQEARSGVFRDMLFSGEQALKGGDFQAAEFYLHEALKFLQNRPVGENKVALDRFNAQLLESFIVEGQRSLRTGNYDKALSFFDRAVELEDRFGLSGHIRLNDLRLEALEGKGVEMLNSAENFLNRRRYAEALQGLREAAGYIERHGLSGHSKGKLALVADQYYREALQRIDQSHRARNYDDALKLVAEARTLCDQFPIRCDVGILDQRERLSRQALFNGMVQQAEQVLTRGDLGRAGSLMSEAELYRQQWNGFVNNTPEAIQVTGRIRQRHYQQAIVTGKSLLEMKDHRGALQHFDEAFKLEEQGGFSFDEILREYRRTAALQTLMTDADQLERMLGDASYMATKEKLLKILTLRARYDLQENQVLESRLESLQARMVSAACLQQQSLFEEQISKGRDHEHNKRFVEAGTAYRQAIALAVEHVDCGLSDTLPHKRLESIAHAIRYQEQMNRANEMLSLYKNAESLTAYLKAESIFNEHDLGVMGLTHEPFAAHVLKQNLNYILSAAYYYLEKEDLRSSLRMVDALASRGYPPAQTRLIQEQIGYRLGQQDALKYPGSRWRTSVLQYTEGKRFYRFFRKAYRKGWRSQ